MERLEKALEALGLTQSQIESLKNEETDFDEVIQEAEINLQKVIKTKAGLKSADELKNDFTIKENTFKQKLNKMFGMGMSRADVEKIPYDEFLGQAETFHKTSLDNLSRNAEEQIRKDLDALKTEKVNLLSKLDEIESEKESTIEKMKNDFETRLHEKEVDSLLLQAFSPIKWKDDEMKDVFKDYIIKEVKSKYKIHTDGKVTAPDGTQALSMDQKRIYTSILDSDKERNPILDLAYTKGMVQVSNGGGVKTQKVDGFKPEGDSPATAELIERMKAKGIEV
jgi:hypothetical protein